MDIFEVTTATRDYKCYRCHKLLWNAKLQPDVERTVKDPFTTPGNSIVAR